jgi:hypothetical protein
VRRPDLELSFHCLAFFLCALLVHDSVLTAASEAYAAAPGFRRDLVWSPIRWPDFVL